MLKKGENLKVYYWSCNKVILDHYLHQDGTIYEYDKVLRLNIYLYMCERLKATRAGRTKFLKKSI